MRLLRTGVLATLVMSLLAAALAACAAADPRPTDAELLAKYSPELWLSSPDEPLDVERVLADPGTELRRGGPDGDLVARGGDVNAPLSLATLEAGGWSSEDTLVFTIGVDAHPGFAYARVIRSKGRVLLDYWYAYDHSRGSTVTLYGFELPELFGFHVWDWERIVVVLDEATLDLVEVVYAAHDGAEAVDASKAPRGADGVRPRAYVADLSNAAFPSPGPHPVELSDSIARYAPEGAEIYDQTYDDARAKVVTPEVRVRGEWAASPIYWGQSRDGLTTEYQTVDSPRGPDVHSGPGRQKTAVELVAAATR